MTGKALVEKVLIDMGATKAQVSSKVVDMVIAAFADPDNGLDAYKVYLQTLDDMERKIESASNKMYRAEQLQANAEDAIRRAEAAKKDLEDERAKIRNELLQLETAAARDKIRLMYVFKTECGNLGKLNQYDQNAFIKGLAAILSGGCSNE